jgi:hypothetical protein
MPRGIVHESFLGLLAAYAGCFTALSYRNFELLIVGRIHCLGRRTITAVALASGAVGQRKISAFHRSFSREVWVPDDIGRALFGLAAAWTPADQPLYLVIDDTLARNGGKGVALASMHHDPLLSTSSAACAWTPRSGPDPGDAAPVRAGARASGASACRLPRCWRPGCDAGGHCPSRSLSGRSRPTSSR